MLDITNIPPPRVPLIDERTNLLSREWYRFFLSLFRLTGGGSNDITLEDLQLLPQTQVDYGVLDNSFNQAQLSYLADKTDQIQSELDGLRMVPKPLEVHPIPYGSFFDTTTQTGSTATATTITFNSTDVSKGVYVGATTSRIYVTEAGSYNFQFSLQIENSTATEGDINIWFRINGVDIVGSNGYVWVPGKHAGADGHIITGWNFFISLAANDYVELVWVPSATTMTIKNYAAVAGPPAIPSTYSAVLTAFKVNLTTG